MKMLERIKRVIRVFIKPDSKLYKKLKAMWHGALTLKEKIKKEPISLKEPYSHMYDVKEIVLQQNHKNGYRRLDTFVRLLAVEHEYGLNNNGWELYRKMQEARCGKGSISTDERIDIFKNLIRSWEERGYDESSQIELDAHLMLEDGSHRLALAMYHGLDKINCYVSTTETDVDYTLKWFAHNGFSKDEIKQISDRADTYINNSKIQISCILWPPVQAYFDEITDQIKQEYEVSRVKDVVFADETFDRFVRAVYHIDDIAEWKIDKKREHMMGTPTKRVRLIVLELDKPQFRYKGATKNTILVQGETLKDQIRYKYQDKVDNYFFDIICHTGDNSEQSEYIRKLFDPMIDLKGYFTCIQDKYSWQLIKLDTPYKPENFPEEFAFSKDIDMVCSPDDFENMIATTVSYFEKECSGYYDNVKSIRKSDNNHSLRIELNGFLIFMIDIWKQSIGLADGYDCESLARRIKVGTYFVPDDADELCYRLAEYIDNPDKIKHLEYVKKHIDKLNEQRVRDNVKGVDKILKLLR